MQRDTLDEALGTELEAMARGGLRRALLDLELGDPGWVRLGAERYLDFASNDYLGLGRLPATVEAAGSARASRLVTGNLGEHVRAERALAELVGLPHALLFTSGYAANVGTVPSLVGRGDLILSDQLNHASLIDGSRLSRAEVSVYPHLDLGDLARRLRASQARRVLVITESIFSMEGTHAPLAELRELTRRHGAWLMVDEAHSLGMMGPAGRGSSAAAGIRPDVLVGTLGKAIGAAGAFVAGSEALRDQLIHRARSFVFSTGLAPAVAAAIPGGVQRVMGADAERRHQASLCARLHDGLAALGLDVRGTGPIVSAVYGDPRAAVDAENALRHAGVLARAIRPPTVPRETSRLRLVPSAAHTHAQVDLVLEALR